MTTVSVSVKLLNGDLFAVDVDPLAGFLGLTARLRSLFPDVFPPSMDLAFPSMEEDQKEDPEHMAAADAAFESDQMIFCLVAPRPPPLAFHSVEHVEFDQYCGEDPWTNTLNRPFHRNLHYLYVSVTRPEDVFIAARRSGHPPEIRSDSGYLLRITMEGETRSLFAVEGMALRHGFEGTFADFSAPAQYDLKRHLSYRLGEPFTVSVYNTETLIDTDFYYKLNPEVIPAIREMITTHWPDARDVPAPKSLGYVDCPCGSVVKRGGASAHRATKKHQAYEAALMSAA